MQCRMCGFEFNEKNIPNRGCRECGKSGCNYVHCPNCGYANSSEFEEEFEFIKKLKDKLKDRK